MCSVLSFSDEAGEPFAIPAGEDLHVPPNATVCTISFLSIINIAVQATHTSFLVKIPHGHLPRLLPVVSGFTAFIP